MPLSLEQKLELKQSQEQLPLQLQLQLYLPPEFAEYLDFEKDEDTELLRRSIAFLSLHEFSHLLYDRGKVTIPTREEAGSLTEMPGLYDHNATEVGIDKSAMLLGPTQGITAENMHLSHTAMMERVFRDCFEQRKRQIDHTLLARCYCEIKEHSGETRDDLLKKKLERMLRTAEREIAVDQEVFQRKVALYSMIYRNTRLNF